MGTEILQKKRLEIMYGATGSMFPNSRIVAGISARHSWATADVAISWDDPASMLSAGQPGFELRRLGYVFDDLDAHGVDAAVVPFILRSRC